MTHTSMLQSLLEEFATESSIRTDSIEYDLEQLNLLDYAIEAKQKELVRGCSLYNTIQAMTDDYLNDHSFESHHNYHRSIEQVLLASGLDLPVELFTSFEAAKPKGEEDGENTTPDDKSELTKKTASDPKDKVDDDKKDAKPKVDKKETMSKVKETLGKVKEWLSKKTEEFTKWLSERAKRIGIMKEKVDTQTDAVADKLKGS